MSIAWSVGWAFSGKGTVRPPLLSDALSLSHQEAGRHSNRDHRSAAAAAHAGCALDLRSDVNGERAVVVSDVLPDLPTVAEFVPGYESSGYFGFGAPAKTPAEIVDKLNTEINAGLADPRLKAQLADLGGIILGGSPDDFRTLVAEETEKWGKVIRDANIKPE